MRPSRIVRPMRVSLFALVLLVGCFRAPREIRRAASRGDLAQALTLYRAHAVERGDGDADLLADVARTMIRNAAGSSDARTRSAGFSALRALGSRGLEVLEDLAHRPGVVGDRAASTLFELEGRSGAPPARLRAALASTDPERRVTAMIGLASEADLPRLIGLLRDDDPSVRRTAAQILARVRGRRDVLDALAEVSREDAVPAVRAAAVMALGASRDSARDALRAALSDPDVSVRMAVPSALMGASAEISSELLSGLLVEEPDPMAIEAARVLASHHDLRAEEYILAAIDSPRAGVRAQAAVAAMGLGADRAPALARHMTHSDPEVALRVASLMVRREEFRADAQAALRAMSRRPDGFVAIRALALLAASGDGTSGEAIREALDAPDATVRRLAVLAWHDVVGTSGEVDPLAPRLIDSDASVALLAAVEIVRITSR